MTQRNASLNHARQVTSNIENHGFHATGVLGDQFVPDYTYTTGFLLRGHPELVCVGLHGADANAAFHRLFDEIGVIDRPRGAHAPFELMGVSFCLLDVPVEHWIDDDAPLGGIPWFHGDDLHARDPNAVLQLVWPDPAGRFPWQPGCDPSVVRDQPILARGDQLERSSPRSHALDGRDECPERRPENRAARRARPRRR